MKPYYDDKGITIYHGDCRDVFPSFASQSIGAFVTDPPYGVGLGVNKDMRKNGHGLAKQPYATYDDTYENYVRLVPPVFAECLRVAKRGASFIGPHIQELPKASAIGGVYCSAGTGRHAWGFITFITVLFYGIDPMLHKGARPNVIHSNARAEDVDHPCPKPLEWMRWLIDRVVLPGETIIDPFMGSGGTLRAAKDLGYQAIGIEQSEHYCEIAARRLSQEVMDLSDCNAVNSTLMV